MKSLLVVTLLFAGLSFAPAQEPSILDTTFTVYGNCSMCKTRIEKTLAIDGVRYARWNKSTKMLRVAFMTDALSVDSLQKRLAAVGHDTDRYKAADAVYEALPACCLYRHNAETH